MQAPRARAAVVCSARAAPRSSVRMAAIAMPAPMPEAPPGIRTGKMPGVQSLVASVRPPTHYTNS